MQNSFCGVETEFNFLNIIQFIVSGQLFQPNLCLYPHEKTYIIKYYIPFTAWNSTKTQTQDFELLRTFLPSALISFVSLPYQQLANVMLLSGFSSILCLESLEDTHNNN